MDGEADVTPEAELMMGPLTCSSLVFFDLETTGVPAFHNPRITELSFCSVDRQQFLECKPGNLPRVTNRLNLCIYPWRQIDPVASEKTLLDNYNLEHQSGFDEDVFTIIYSFLNRLKKPICLVAHNGHRFDFPIFKAEIDKLGKVVTSSSSLTRETKINPFLDCRSSLMASSALIPSKSFKRCSLATS